LAIFGYSAEPKINVSKLTISPKRQKRGRAVEFSFAIRSLASETQKLVIDFAIYYVKASGKQAPKILKLRNINLTSNQEMQISRKVRLKNTSGRTIYPGRHEIELKINGKSYSRNWFVVEKDWELFETIAAKETFEIVLYVPSFPGARFFHLWKRGRCLGENLTRFLLAMNLSRLDCKIFYIERRAKSHKITPLSKILNAMLGTEAKPTMLFKYACKSTAELRNI